MPTVEVQATAESVSYSVRYPGGKTDTFGDGPPTFTFHVIDETHFEKVIHSNDYSAALGFIHGDFDVTGDLVAALRFKLAHSKRSAAAWLYTAAMRVAPRRIETWFRTMRGAPRNVRFHHDRSDDFYRMFLDSRLVYSEAFFGDPAWSLEHAQEAKLDSICRDLDLRPGDRFLDVGCGWGALILLAAERYGANATGCTVSHSQRQYATSLMAARGLAERAAVWEMDYRNLRGRFDKIASIGMYEHVARRRLAGYFRTIYNLLDDRGRFLNSGITRPQPVRDDPQSWFVSRKVLPGGELPHLCDVISAAETAGFEVVKAESVRKHYALTCRAWVERLQENASACVSLVGSETYRTWLLYLATSAFNFETGQTDVHRVLMSKRGQ